MSSHLTPAPVAANTVFPPPVTSHTVHPSRSSAPRVLKLGGSGTVSGFYAISGCRRPNEIGDLNARGCTDEVGDGTTRSWVKPPPSRAPGVPFTGV